VTKTGETLRHKTIIGRERALLESLANAARWSPQTTTRSSTTTRDRPADAPTSEQNRYWYTPGSSS
jgi:hypothetical protein